MRRRVRGQAGAQSTPDRQAARFLFPPSRLPFPGLMRLRRLAAGVLDATSTGELRTLVVPPFPTGRYRVGSHVNP